MIKKNYRGLYILLLMAVFIGVVFTGQVYAAEQSGEYLQYQEPKTSASSSGFSTVAYIFSLLITFAVVIGLAYFASRFLGQKMGNLSAVGNNKILGTLSFGANRAVYIVEVAGKFLVLGVTDHNINVLQEITDAKEIEKMRAEQVSVPITEFDRVFQRQLASLQKLSKTFPNVFDAYKHNEQKHESEKR